MRATTARSWLPLVAAWRGATCVSPPTPTSCLAPTAPSDRRPSKASPTSKPKTAPAAKSPSSPNLTMQLTKELLESRRKVANKHREELIAQVNHQAGVIDAIDH